MEYKTVPIPLALNGINNSLEPINLQGMTPNMKNMIVDNGKIRKRLGYNQLGWNSLDNSLVAHFKMNDDAASTDVVDSSDSGHTGTAQQNTEDLSTDGLATNTNAALSFNGTSDYIETSESADFDLDLDEDDFSFCLIASFDAVNANQQCLFSASADDDNRFEFMYDKVSFENPALAFVVSEDGSITTYYRWEITLVVGTSYHIVLTNDSGELSCYVNNIKLTSIECESSLYGEGTYGRGAYGY